MQPSWISFEYEPDLAELVVEAVSSDFRGRVRTTVKRAAIAEIDRFAEALSRYPLQKCVLTLSCTALVKLTAFQVDAVGHLVLAAEIGEGELLDETMVRIRLSQDWPGLNRFGSDLARLVRGDASRIEVHGFTR